MKTKICSKCNKEKYLNEYYNEKKNNDGKTSQCIECTKFYSKKYYIKNKNNILKQVSKYRNNNKEKIKNSKQKYIKNNPWFRTWWLIYMRCTNTKNPSYKYYGGKGIKCLITKDELKEIWFRDKAYLMEHPSIDRINSNDNYIFYNCRYIEMRINSGNTSKNITILQYSLDEIFIKEWSTIASASKKLKIFSTNIIACCKGIYKQSGGFIWKFKRDNNIK
jgi:hypothetical protein